MVSDFRYSLKGIGAATIPPFQSYVRCNKGRPLRKRTSSVHESRRPLRDGVRDKYGWKREGWEGWGSKVWVVEPLHRLLHPGDGQVESVLHFLLAEVQFHVTEYQVLFEPVVCVQDCHLDPNSSPLCPSPPSVSGVGRPRSPAVVGCASPAERSGLPKV